MTISVPTRYLLRGVLVPFAHGHAPILPRSSLRALQTSAKRALADHHSQPSQNPSPPTLRQLRAQAAAAAEAPAPASATSDRPTPSSPSSSLTPPSPDYTSTSISGSVPLRTPWPWHTVSSTPDATILERTVFARPSDLPPTLLLFAAGVWGLFVFTFFALPDPRKRELDAEELAEIERLEQRAKEAGFAARLGNKLAGSIFASSQPILMGGITLFLGGIILGASRIVTRITMVQVRSAQAATATATATATGAAAAAAAVGGMTGEGRTFLRLQSVGHEMFRSLGMFRPRQVEVEDCRPYLLDSDRATTVRLRIVPRNKRQSLLDRFPYSLDFRTYDSTSTKAGQDVVLSQNRLEHVFGRLRKAGTYNV